tara:strand:+ start:226 stop:972 length:747 start_codon:yes stop_codon:yes gene_type:complete
MIYESLSTKTLGNKIKYFSTIDSTNAELWRILKKKKLNEGYVVFADNQTDGKGRRGDKWISNKGESLTFSILLKPYFSINKIGLISILSAISVVSAIEKSYNIKSNLKWPNDVLASKKKLGGILVESKIIKNKIHLVVGIGININQKLMMNELIDKAISIRMINKKKNSIDSLFLSILDQLEIFYSMPIETWIKVWENYCNHINTKIKFHNNNNIFEGIFIGLSKNGEAMIKKNNSIQNFPSGVINLI